MKSDRKRLKAEKADLVNQMQQLYATLESREEQLRDFIRNYEQHRKVWQARSDCIQAPEMHAQKHPCKESPFFVAHSTKRPVRQT